MSWQLFRKNKGWRRGPILSPKRSVLYFNKHLWWKESKMSLTCYLPIQHLPPGLSNGGTHCAAIIVHSIMQINFSLLAVPRIRQLGAGFSPWIPRFDSWPVHKELDTGFSPSTLAFPCLLFHQFCIPIYTLIILLLEEQRGDAWKPSRKAIIFHVSLAHCSFLVAEGLRNKKYCCNQATRRRGHFEPPHFNAKRTRWHF